MLYRPTKDIRATVVQEAAVILPPDPEAPKGSVRTVQVTIPEAPEVYVKIDGDPKAAGANRTPYKWPSYPSGQMIEFDLLPHQSIAAAAAEGYAELSLIVQYRSE